MSLPFFSIVVPMYCGSKYVPAILDTVRAQDLDPKDFELILVDDASPDNSLEECRCILSTPPEFDVKLLSNPVNLRQGGARNRGVDHASGKWIVFLDVDDLFVTGALSRIKKKIEEFDTDGLDLIFVDNFMKEAGTIIQGTCFPISQKNQSIMSGADYMRRCNMPSAPWSVIYSRSLLQEKNIRFVENLFFEDTDYVFNATRLARKVRFIPEHLVIYHRHDSQTTANPYKPSIVRDRFKLCHRMGLLAIETALDNMAAARTIFACHRRMKNQNFRFLLWRIPRKNIIEILRESPNLELEGVRHHFITRLAAKHPVLFGNLITLAKPLLSFISHHTALLG